MSWDTRKRWDEVSSIIAARRQHDTPAKRACIDVRQRYNGDYVLPLWNVSEQPVMNSLAPQLISDAIESQAQRAASTMPVTHVPAVIASQSRSRERAQTRRRAIEAFHLDSQLDLILGRAFRHLAGYGTNAFVIDACFEEKVPRIKLRDPLTSYPQPRTPEDVDPPDDCGFFYLRSPGEMMEYYPNDIHGNSLTDYWKGLQRSDYMVEVVEWFDEDQISVGTVGIRNDLYANQYIERTMTTAVQLSCVPNRMGECPVVVGNVITLDRIQAAVSKIVPITDMLDKITLLEMVAAQRSVFPDRYILGQQGQTPQLVNGQKWKDGATGEMNLVMGAGGIGELNSGVGPATAQVQGYLERAARNSSGNPAMFQGESNGSLRSGQTVNALANISVDPAMAEMQKVMAAHLRHVNMKLMGCAKAYFGSKQFSMYSGQSSDLELVEFTPNKDFESFENRVEYPMAGQDVGQATVAVGQLVGAELMSKRTGRVKHPLIDNPDNEERQIEREALSQALRASIQQQASNPQGGMPVMDLARIIQLLDQGVDLPDAVLQAQGEAQKRQASQAPPPEAGMATAPEAQPGLSPPGAGVEAQPSIGPVAGGLDNVHQLFQALRQPAPAR